MKKLFLSIVMLTVVFAFAKNENTAPKKNEISTITLNEVSSFCKLIQIGDYDAVKSLIESGEDVNRKSTGLTPLMFAARHNKAKIATLLINNGANLKAKSDRKGFTALKYAEISGAKDAYAVIKMALENKKNNKKKKDLVVLK